MIPYSRTFPYPVDRAFEWLTDYTDHDAALTDAVQRRRKVLSREKDKITMEGEIDLLGSRGAAIVEVALAPPSRWTATIVKGPSRGSVYEYALTPTAGGGSRLDVAYRVRVKRLSSFVKVALARPFARRRLHAMWEGFARSMAKDLG